MQLSIYASIKRTQDRLYAFVLFDGLMMRPLKEMLMQPKIQPGKPGFFTRPQASSAWLMPHLNSLQMSIG